MITSFLKKTFKWLLLIFFMLLFVSLLKLFLVGFYVVPTGSMKDTILPDDYIVVNKLSYGPKWPQSPLQISWFNLLALNDYLFSWFRDTRWTYLRWPRVDLVNRDDVFVFEPPFNYKTLLVKRCKGLPGELLELRKDELYINGTLSVTLETITYDYKSILFDSAVYSVQQMKNNFSNEFRARLHPKEVEILRSNYSESDISICSYGGRKNNDYGPVLIPEKGLTINLYNYKHEIEPYKRVINRFEGGQLTMLGDTILINGSRDSLYTFKQDYYFMMGDNRHGSGDSRRWGFVPEENIVGKASYIWFSKDGNDHVRWDRLFQKID